MSVQRSITHYSTQFMYIYLFICRVCNGAQTGTLVLGKLALLVLLTNRFQYIPRVLAVLVGVDDVRQHQHILRGLALPLSTSASSSADGSRNTCSPKSSESAERKRAPHVCAWNDVQESDHAPCNICKCPHLVGCDCPCLHIQQVQGQISDASRGTCKPPSHLASMVRAFRSSRPRQNQFLMRLETHMQGPIPP